MGWLPHLWYWIEIHTGIARGGPDPYYNAFSGVLSDIGELSIITGMVVGAKHINCFERGCWRLGHKVEGSSVRACHKHHPVRPRSERNGSVKDMHQAQTQESDNRL